MLPRPPVQPILQINLAEIDPDMADIPFTYLQDHLPILSSEYVFLHTSSVTDC